MLILKGVSEKTITVRFTPDGRGLETFTWRGIQRWPDWSAGGKPVAVAELAKGLTAEAYSTDGRYIIGISSEGLTLSDRAAGTTTILNPELQVNSVLWASITSDGRRVITSHHIHGQLGSYLRCTAIEAPHPVVWNVLTWGVVYLVALLDANRFVSFVAVKGGGTLIDVHDAATGVPVGKTFGLVPYQLERRRDAATGEPVGQTFGVVPTGSSGVRLHRSGGGLSVAARISSSSSSPTTSPPPRSSCGTRPAMRSRISPSTRRGGGWRRPAPTARSSSTTWRRGR